MKRWSLGTELRLWSALLVAAILLVVGSGVAIYQQHQEMSELDHQLQLIGDHFLAVYRKNGADPAWVTPEAVENTIAETSGSEWFIEVVDAAGKPLYRSHSLAGLSFSGVLPGLSDFDLGESGIRVGVFSDQGVTLRLGIDLDDLNELSSSLLIAVAIVFPGILAIIYFGARWLAARALAPVRVLTDAAERVSARNPGERLPVLPPADELARLATVLNATFDRLAAAFNQATRFSADASHEFQTPIAIARSGLERLLASPSLVPSDRADAVEALDQLRRITHITRTLLVLSRADAGQLGLQPVAGHLVELVTACGEDARVLADTRLISVSIECQTSDGACFDREGTTIILQNLLENAVKYNIEGGRIIVRVTESNGFCWVEIANTGPSIPASHRPRVFDRFFRAADVSSITGHGLGLSIARELARAQGGDVVLHEDQGSLTVFILALPSVSDGNGNRKREETPRVTSHDMSDKSPSFSPSPLPMVSLTSKKQTI
ncbi:MAG: ATP-binding protein [Luteolibacter sp.]|uniref:HAMP domain-containing sensor histidine kinase n=1 Tax=Luteolibacter sp. TaxID=1962973 RepID=UPI003265EA60